jgi:hypothetical protein
MLGGSQHLEFPVAEVVSGVYLKKVGYESGDSWEAAKFLFHRDGAWLSVAVFNPKPVDDEELLKKRRYRAATRIESIASIFLGEEIMRECFREADSFRGFVQNIVNELNNVDYKNVELDIKTLRTDRGIDAGLTRPFIRRKGDKRFQLSYSEFEIKIITNARKTK